MPKFCVKCGNPLNENDKCPNCDVVTEQFKKKKSKKLLPAMLAVVFLGVAVAGALFANHQGLIDFPFLRNNNSEQQSASNEENGNITEGDFSPETAYSAVLKTYKDAFANNYYSNDEDEWDDKNEYDISKVNPEISREFSGIEYPLSYCFLDISNDDVPELIISIDYGDEAGQHIVDILGYENGQVKRLFSLWTFGARASYSIHTNGYISYYGSGGAMYSGETYYQLEENSASPEVKADFSIEYTDYGTKYYTGSEDNQQEITESEYNAKVDQFGEEVTLKWTKLCESKLYEAEFSVRGDSGISSGYQQLYVTNETSDEITVVYRQVGQTGYPVYVDRGTVFKISKNGEKSNVTWKDLDGNEFTGAASYNGEYFSLTYKTASPNAAVKECTGTDLYPVDQNSHSNYSGSEQETTTASNNISSVNLSPDIIWATLVGNEWYDENGNRIKFEKNITYYKLKPNATHTSGDYFMGSVTADNSEGHYFGHYHIDDDFKLRFEFNYWPNHSAGLLLNEKYVWDPSLQENNSWCLTSDGKIMFSQGTDSFCGTIYTAKGFMYYQFN